MVSVLVVTRMLEVDMRWRMADGGGWSCMLSVNGDAGEIISACTLVNGNGERKQWTGMVE